jgi:murein DD-endopeptidase MepM/ murein hydrolase activator NlpD
MRKNTLGALCMGFILPLPFATSALALPEAPPPPVRMGTLDQIWGAPEEAIGTSGDYVSGSVTRVGRRNVNKDIAPSQGKKSPHVLYSDPLLGNIPGLKDVQIPKWSVQGKKWVLGTSQMVPGGFNELKVMFLGKEPAGRMVVNLGYDHPAEFKMVLVKIDPSTATAYFMPFLRACIPYPFTKVWRTCSPFGIPSGVIIPIKEKMTMPIDINKPAFNFKLTKAMQGKIASALNPANLKRMGISMALDAASSVASGVSSGGGGGSSSSPNSAGQTNTGTTSGTGGGAGLGTDSQGAYSGVFNGQTMSPVNGPPTSNWGQRVHPKTGRIKHHDGMDFGVNVGTPVHAAAAGQIMFQGQLSGYGNTLIINHGSGYMTLYAHLQDGGFVGQVGGTVPMGAVVALSGNSGTSTAPHLHFTAISGGDGQSIHSGHDIDPRQFLRR